jgi:hypothetical protein
MDQDNDNFDNKINKFIMGNYMTKIYDPTDPNDLRCFIVKKFEVLGREKKPIDVVEQRQGRKIYVDINGNKVLDPRCHLSKGLSRYFMDFSTDIKIIYSKEKILFTNTTIIREFIIPIYTNIWKEFILEELEKDKVFTREEFERLINNSRERKNLSPKKKDYFSNIKKSLNKHYISLDALCIDHSVDFEIDGGEHIIRYNQVIDRARDRYLKALFNIETIRLFKYGKRNPYKGESELEEKDSSKEDFEMLYKKVKEIQSRPKLPKTYSQYSIAYNNFLNGVGMVEYKDPSKIYLVKKYRKNYTIPLIKIIYNMVSRGELAEGIYASFVLKTIAESNDVLKGISLQKFIIEDVNTLLKVIFDLNIEF